MMRQTGKQILTIATLLLLTLGARAEAIVTDPLTGVAIDGYDVVSYFTAPEPAPGTPQFNHVWQGVSWYFSSAANRDVFMRNPHVYAPQFGGHCLTSLSKGYLSDGKPTLYALEAMKLYLFYSAANREAFLASPRETIGRAEQQWAERFASARAPSNTGMPSVAPEAEAVHVQHN